MITPEDREAGLSVSALIGLNMMGGAPPEGVGCRRQTDQGQTEPPMSSQTGGFLLGAAVTNRNPQQS